MGLKNTRKKIKKVFLKCRLGVVPLGEASVVIGVTSVHRKGEYLYYFTT